MYIPPFVLTVLHILVKYDVVRPNFAVYIDPLVDGHPVSGTVIVDGVAAALGVDVEAVGPADVDDGFVVPGNDETLCWRASSSPLQCFTASPPPTPPPSAPAIAIATSAAIVQKTRSESPQIVRGLWEFSSGATASTSALGVLSYTYFAVSCSHCADTTSGISIVLFHCVEF
jgi:hypothetical protein